MAQWGRNDQSVTANSSTTVETSNGAPMGTWALVKGDQVSRTGSDAAHYGNTSAGSRAKVDVDMFNNTTPGAFIPGVAVGVFGVDATEISVSTGALAEAYVTSGGSGYDANATVTLTYANGVTNAVAITSVAGSTNANTGRITSLVIANSGSGFINNPTIVIAAPAAANVVANSSGFSNTTDFFTLTSANSRFQVNDRVRYTVPAANVAIAPLVSGNYYYISFANSSGFKLATAPNSPTTNVDITDTRATNAAPTHTFLGDTATGYVVVGGAKNKGVAHAGWVLRTEGTGGRAGRVQYETLVAMGSLGAQTAAYGTPANVADASDDTFLPDS